MLDILSCSSSCSSFFLWLFSPFRENKHGWFIKSVIESFFFFFLPSPWMRWLFNETLWAQNSPVQDALLIYTRVMYPVCVAEYAAENNTASFPFHSHFLLLSLSLSLSLSLLPLPFAFPLFSLLYLPKAHLARYTKGQCESENKPT